MKIRSCYLSPFAALGAMLLMQSPGTARASTILGSAQSYAVLGAASVTNTDATTIGGDVGVYAGTSISGSGGITQTSGTIHDTDASAQQAQSDSHIAYGILGGLSAVTANLSGQDLGSVGPLAPGLYRFDSSAQLTGTLTLDFAGASNEDFVFQIGSALTTASGSTVLIENGNATDGVFFQVVSSATLGSDSVFAGNIIADQSVTFDSGASLLCGRAIALTASVTMDNDTISNDCAGAGAEGRGASDFNSDGYSGGTFGNVGDVAPEFDGNPADGATSVPEPGSLAVLAVGLAGLGTLRRRRAPRASTASPNPDE